jgi:uncharacterized protein (DUF2249 family)
MTPKQRWIILGGLLAATLVAGYLVEDEPVPEKSKRKGSVASKSAVSSPAESRRAGAREQTTELAAAPLNFPEPAPVEEVEEGEKRIDPFRNKTWYIAPPPPKPPKPTAPPLPFQFLGKLNEEGEIRVFLNHQGKHIIAKVGDVINNTYTVEEISGGQMVLLYQPLKEKQILSIGSDK